MVRGSWVKPGAIVIDVGKVKRRDLREFREGQGKLADDVKKAVEDARKTSSPEAAKKEFQSVVLLYRKRGKRRSRRGAFSFF